MPETVAVYFDYLCPFAWRGAELAELVADELGLRFEWHHFSLVQAHRATVGDAAQLWNDRIDPDDAMGGRGLRAFLASSAARRQGPEAFDRFRLGLLRARHRDGVALTEPTMTAVAETAGLQLARFERDLADPELRTCLAQEHHRAVDRDVFGTPTFAFRDGAVADLRIRELPHGRREAVTLFRAFRDLLETYPYLETIRRPRAKRN